MVAGRTRRAVAVAWLAATLGGCAGRDPNVPIDTGCPADRSPPSRTLEFVMTTVGVAQRVGSAPFDPDLPIAGFNLDGRFPMHGDGCNGRDYFSALDPDQNLTGAACTDEGCGGVDNQMPLVTETIQATLDPAYRYDLSLRREVETGERVILLRVSGLDDVYVDDAIELTLLLGFDADADCANNHTGAGRFVVDTRSYTDGDPSRPRWRAQGSVVSGRLRTEAFEGTVPAPVGRRIVDVAAHASQMRFNLPGCHGRVAGNWGGWVSGREMLDAWSAEVPNLIDEMSQLFPLLIDIRVDGICHDTTTTPRRFGGISFGFGFDLASAQIVGDAPGPPAGSCGAQRSDAGRD